jgi:hypothetical protein
MRFTFGNAVALDWSPNVDRAIKVAICVDVPAGSIVTIVFHRRLAAIVLALALFGANTAMASVCDAYCAGVGIKSSDHHHHYRTPAAPSPSHHHMHAQRHRAECPQCPEIAGKSSLLPDCGAFAQVQALQENSRAFSDDHAVSQLDIAKSSTGSSPALNQSERFSSLHSPPNISSFQPVLVSIRI